MRWHWGVSLGGLALFKEQKSESRPSKSELHNTQLWKCVIVWTNEISEDLTRGAVDVHQARKEYKTMSKEFGLYQFTDKRKTFNTIVTLPSSGQPTNIRPRSRSVIVQEVTRDPMVTSRNLKASLAMANVSVHVSTIRRTLNIKGVHGCAESTKPLLQKEHCCPSLIF